MEDSDIFTKWPSTKTLRLNASNYSVKDAMPADSCHTNTIIGAH